MVGGMCTCFDPSATRCTAHPCCYVAPNRFHRPYLGATTYHVLGLSAGPQHTGFTWTCSLFEHALPMTGAVSTRLLATKGFAVYNHSRSIAARSSQCAWRGHHASHCDHAIIHPPACSTLKAAHHWRHGDKAMAAGNFGQARDRSAAHQSQSLAAYSYQLP
jgi:hypothetical protein